LAASLVPPIFLFESEVLYMVLAARETRVISVLFLVTFFSLGLFLISRHSSLGPIFDRGHTVHASNSTFTLINNTTPSSAPSRVVWGNNSVPETEVLLHKVAGMYSLRL
jgi:hypothetical protein